VICSILHACVCLVSLSPQLIFTKCCVWAARGQSVVRERAVSCSRCEGPLPIRAMGKEPDGWNWVPAAAARLEEKRGEHPKGGSQNAADVFATFGGPVGGSAAAPVEPFATGGDASSSSAGTRVRMTTARSVHLTQHRQSGEGLLVTGFELQRHSVVVCGRPVQFARTAVQHAHCTLCQ
jgi:hypothetical protein